MKTNTDPIKESLIQMGIHGIYILAYIIVMIILLKLFLIAMKPNTSQSEAKFNTLTEDQPFTHLEYPKPKPVQIPDEEENEVLANQVDTIISLNKAHLSNHNDIILRFTNKSSEQNSTRWTTTCSYKKEYLNVSPEKELQIIIEALNKAISTNFKSVLLFTHEDLAINLVNGSKQPESNIETKYLQQLNILSKKLDIIIKSF